MPALQKKHKKSSVHNIKSVMNTRYVMSDQFRYMLKIEKIESWCGFGLFQPYFFAFNFP